ncbi:hypothetical protein L208DRAFT_1374185 [Tricholoma matsutake]|nr:hypothetical protein L208DRAFT_1374185 [Tricholoma matsutake 945]
MSMKHKVADVEQAWRLTVLTGFLDKLAESGWQTCVVCDRTIVELAHLASRAWEHWLGKGLVNTNGLSGGNVCLGCLEDLQGCCMPELALNGSFCLHEIPKALEGLKFLERLLVSLCFHIQYTVEVQESKDRRLYLNVMAKPLASTLIILDYVWWKLSIGFIPTIDAWVTTQLAAERGPLEIKRTHNGFMQFPDIMADTFPKAFPHIFPNGVIPFDLSITGQAWAMGCWAIAHSSQHFDNEFGFYYLLLEMCQCDEVVSAVVQLPKQLENASWDVHLKYLNGMLSNLRVGQPSFVVTLEPDGKPISATYDSSGYHLYLGDVIWTHQATADEESPRQAAQNFDAWATVVKSQLLTGKNDNSLFRKSMGFLGRVEWREGTALAMKLLLWVEELQWPLTVRCDMAAIYKRGPFCSWDLGYGLKPCPASAGESRLCGLYPTEGVETGIGQEMQYNFHHGAWGARTPEMALALVSVDGLKKYTQHERMEMAMHAVLREANWSEVEMVRMLSDQAQYYESHWFFTLDAEAVRSSLMTENSQQWCEAPQIKESCEHPHVDAKTLGKTAYREG